MKNKFMYGGGVLTTLFLTILFCLASCNNSSSPVNDAPKIIGAYTLNGDIICLYDDNTFTIIKDNVVTVSGTYTNDTDGYKLTVGQASDDKATSGDTLVLKVEGNGNINVSQSDIDGYEEGDKGEQTVTPSQTGNPGSDDSTSDIRHSLRDDVSEELKIKENFSAVQNADGIFIKFSMPKGTNSYEVYIDGIGLVTENYFGVGNMTEDDFFYPFLVPNKEYTIQVVFFEAEVEKDGWNYGRPDGDGLLGWFDVKATAGASSKGEVRLNDFGKITVEKNGDFKFTKKPVFENESLMQDWILGIGLSEGVSWLHDDRRSKWLTEIDIPNKEILNKKYNFYTYPRPYGDVTKVDFIVYRPKLFYKYGEKEYKYQWDGKTLDTNCTAESELWTNININNSTDVAKIKGTWTENGEWNNTDDDSINVHVVYNSVLVIGATTVKNWSYTYTKLDGSAFTKEELLDDYIRAYSYRYETVNSSEVKEFEESLSKDSKVLNFKKELLSSPGTEEVYRYTIYTFPDNYCTLSNDGKTLTQKYEDTERPLSEYFADRKYDDGYTKHYDLKLFNDSLLRIIQSGTESDGEDYEWYNEYKKQ